MAFLVYEGSVLNYVLTNADFLYVKIRGTTKMCLVFYNYALVSGVTNLEYLYIQLPKDRNEHLRHRERTSGPLYIFLNLNPKLPRDRGVACYMCTPVPCNLRLAPCTLK